MLPEQSAFKLRRGLNMPEIAESPEAPAVDSAANGAAGTADSANKSTKIESMPTHFVTDGSRIDISMVTHEFEAAMAKNGFTSMSYQVSL